MLYYLIILSIVLIPGLLKLKYKKDVLSRTQSKVLVFIVGLFLCGGYMTGSDWRSYELLFYEALLRDIDSYQDERLFYLFICGANSIINDFWIFVILVKFLAYYVLLSFLREHTSNLYISLFFMIPLYGFFMLLDNPLRFMVANVFVIFSYRFWLKNKMLSSLILIAIAFLFHYTSLACVLFYFTRKVRLPRMVWVAIYLSSIVFVRYVDLLELFTGFFNLFPALKVVQDGYGGYIERSSDYSVTGLSLYMHLFFFLIILLNEQKIVEQKGGAFYSLALQYFIVFTLGCSLPTGFRFSYFIFPFFLIVLTQIISITTQGIKKFFLRGLLFCYIFLSVYKKIDNAYVYLPYTNYAAYIFSSNKPSYYFRSNYNLEHFRKRKGRDVYSNK